MDDFDKHYALQAICCKDLQQCEHSSKICQFPFFRCKKDINPLDHVSLEHGSYKGECPEYNYDPSVFIVETPEPVVKSKEKPKEKSGSILDLF